MYLPDKGLSSSTRASGEYGGHGVPNCLQLAYQTGWSPVENICRIFQRPEVPGQEDHLPQMSL